MRTAGLLLAAILIMAGSGIVGEAAEGAAMVTLQKNEAGYRLLRNGQPFFIKGAGGTGDYAALASAGANATRTWQADRKSLDNAAKTGLSVLVGLPLGKQRSGFDYTDATQVEKQRQLIRGLVLDLKDHPAVLMWALGNEATILTTPEQRSMLWKEVNHLAEIVRSIDPAHPIITVVGGEQWKDSLAELDTFCPALDAVGLNAYADMLTLPEALTRQGWKRPYIVTEFGPHGHWQVARNEWKARLEDSSTEKAAFYRRAYEHAVKDRPQCLGAFAFVWGWKMEMTHTWYGMLLQDGSRTGAVDVMTEIWTGKPPANRCPRIGPGGIQLRQDSDNTLHCTVDVSDPDGDALQIEWDLRRDVSDHPSVGGDSQPLEPAIPGAVLETKEAGAVIRMTGTPGRYRVFVYVRDGHGGAATANVPVLAK